MPDQDGTDSQEQEIRFLSLLTRHTHVNAPSHALSELGDTIEMDPDIDAAEFRAWVDERIADASHPNHFSPKKWNNLNLTAYHPEDYAGLERNELRPMWDAVYKHVPEAERPEFPPYGPPASAPETYGPGATRTRGRTQRIPAPSRPAGPPATFPSQRQRQGTGPRSRNV